MPATDSATVLNAAATVVSSLQRENATLREAAKEARRLIGFMTNEKIAEAARVLETALEK